LNAKCHKLNEDLRASEKALQECMQELGDSKKNQQCRKHSWRTIKDVHLHLLHRRFNLAPRASG